MKSSLLFYTAIFFISFLLIWITIINSNSSDLAPGTREGIQKGKVATQELKDEVYTRQDFNVTETGSTSILDILPIRLSTLVLLVIGINMFVFIFNRMFRW